MVRKLGVGLLFVVAPLVCAAHECTLANGTVVTGKQNCLGIGAIKDVPEPGDAKEVSPETAAANARKATTAKAEAMKETYTKYCNEMGYYGLPGAQCASEQVADMEWLLRFKDQVVEKTPQYEKLGTCIGRFHNKATGVYDAKMIKYCYNAP